MDSLQLEDTHKTHLETITGLLQSASLLAGICKFKKRSQEGVENAPELEQEQNRSQLILKTIQLTQQSLVNSLKLEPTSIQTIQSTIDTEEDPLQPTPLEDLTLHTQHPNENPECIQFDHQLIYSQLQIKQNTLNQWLKLMLDFTPDSKSEAESEPDALAASQDPSISINPSEQDELDEFYQFPSDLDSSEALSSSEEDAQHTNLSYTTTLNDAESTSSDDSDISNISSSSAEQIPTKNKTKTTKASKPNPSSLNEDGFFDLAEFESEVNQGENQMRKKLRRTQKQPSGQDSDDDQDDSEDIDLFSPYRTGPMDDENGDDDGQEDDSMFNLDAVADLRYNDFFAPIKAKNQTLIKTKLEKQEKATVKKNPVVSKDGSEKNKTQSKSKSSHENSDPKPQSTKTGGRVAFLEQVSVQEIPAKNRGLRVSELFGEDDDDDDDDDFLSSDDDGEDEPDDADSDKESSSSLTSQYDPEEEDDESMDEQDPVNRETKTMSRMDSELFDDDFSSNEGSDVTDTDMEDQEASDKNVSRHAKKMKVLSKEIARLEAENVAKKDWMLKGEASSKDRPENSLLEQDLEFEHVQKIAPAVTEEKTMNLESLIKQRILEANYDDVVRKRLMDPKAFLPSRLLELSDAQPTQSLTEIYEESYRNNKKESETGEKTMDVRDEKLEKQHLEIKEMFESLSNKLDGLSNAHFTPPEPKIKVKTINNLPTVAIESALPTATGTGTLLAPEEVFKVKNAKDIVKDVDSLTHSQKQNLRTQAKKRKQKNNSNPVKTNPQGISSSSTKDNNNKSLDRLSTKDQKQISIDHLNKISSNLNSNLTSNTSVTVLNKRGLNLNNDSKGKQRKLVDGSAFKL